MNALLKKVYDLFPAGAQDLILSGYSVLLDRQRYSPKFREYQALLRQTERFSAAQLGAYQDEQLRRVVKYAYETVPYYRRTFDERGLKPESIKTRADLAKLPLLDKNVLRHQFEELVSSDVPRKQMLLGHSSGTTGTPIEVAYCPSMIAMTYAALDRQYAWAGARMMRGGDRIAIARGNIIVPVDRKRPPFWRYNYFHNQLYLSSFHMSGENLAAYSAELRRFKPVVLDGYPSTLYILARYLRSKKEMLPLKAVLSSSETLFDFQREIIEDSFQCRVFDYYGAAERVVFATECDRHEGHHLNEEFGITEVVRADGSPCGPGEEGILVGTSLHNFAMPLLRYQTNDRTALKPQRCSCGRELPLMEDVATKAEDILTLPDGRVISPSVLTHPFKPMTTVEESQLVQEALDHLVIRIVPLPTFGKADEEYLKREFRARLGDEVNITVERVPALPRTKAGKFKWVVSKVGLGV